MNRQLEETDRLLDRALAEIEDSAAPTGLERDVCERVWQRVSGQLRATLPETTRDDRIRSCADFRALLPAYRLEQLPQARRLLMEDHLGECVGCRRALKELRLAEGPQAKAQARGRRRDSRLVTWSWRAVAAAIAVLAVIGLSVRTNVFSFETGGMIRIEGLAGEAFRFSEQESVPLSTGDAFLLAPGESIRTAKGSAALIRLADDSRVEMRERSELAVKQRRRLLPGRRPDGVIELDRGSIIVEASDQGTGHLYVSTQECQVAVTGTVFSVNHGTKGSRVSVIEGAVEVDHHGNQSVLQPGQQVTTNPHLVTVPVEQEIAWSQDVDRYIELLREVRALGREMDRALSPGLRYSTDLLELAPGGTAVYMGIPNVSGGLREAYALLEERLATNEALRAWWQENVERAGTQLQLEQLVEKLHAFGEQLGDEVVVVLELGDEGEMQEPLLLAQLSRPDSFRDFLEREVRSIQNLHGSDIYVYLFEGELPAAADVPAPASKMGLYLWRRGDLIAAAPEVNRLRSYAQELSRDGGRAASSRPFHASLAERYERGVEWLFGVNLDRLISSGGASAATAVEQEWGLLDVEHLIAERKHVLEDQTENRAVLTFKQARRGLAAWLAAPAPVGSLDFVSPDASLAAAFVMKEPGALVEELFGLIEKNNPEFQQELAEFERQQGIDLRRDVAAPLGGEFTLALDGPVLPVPSWKFIIEVYDPQRLQQTLERVSARLSEFAEAAGRKGFRLDRHQAGGREYFELRSLDTNLAVHYLFEEGFLIVAPSRVLLDRAIQTRAMGASLSHARKFTSLLPQDGEVNFSAVLYQDLGPLLGPLAKLGAAQQPAEERKLLSALNLDTEPSLTLLYGEEEQIVLVNTSQGGLFSSGLDALFSAQGLLGAQQSLSLFAMIEQEARSRQER